MTATQNNPRTPGVGYAFHPPSDEGKHRTSLNAYKHGLTGQIHLFSAEEQQAFETHCADIVTALAPVGAIETDLAQAIAQNRWRLKRVSAIESGVFAAGHNGELGFNGAPFRTDAADVPIDDAMSQARTWLAKSDKFQLLALYEQRINRTIERNMAELRTLRAERLAARQEAVEEAALLAQLAKSKGETYRPPADFPSRHFVFSSAEIEPLMLRKQRLDEARALPKTGNNPNPGRQMPAAA